MPAAAEMTVSEHLRRIPPVVRRTVQAARRTVKSAAPKAEEIAYRSSRARGASPPSMYKICRYVVDDVQVAGIGTFPTYASLFFSRGRELDDGSGLLGGTGEARFVRLRTPADAERPAVKRIVRQAFKLGGTTTKRKKR
ncbi:MAG: hypothetical protein ACRDG6_01630 [Candidatus Limnocylindria bacterium]